VTDDTVVRRDDLAHVWHPYTSIDARESGPPIPIVERAEHIYLHTSDGQRLIDGVGSWWVSNLGHGYSRVVDAMQRQLAQMPHVSMAGLTHAPAATLARRLCEVAPPGLSRVFYSDNGSTAVEVAVRAAFQFWQQNGQPERQVFVSLQGAYHGDTIGTVAVGGIPTFHRVFEPLLFETVQVPSPGDANWAETAFAEMSKTIEAQHTRIAAVVVEPLIQGAAGMLMYPPSYLKQLRALCDAHGIFLIVDEVFTGFGRTGTLFACEQAGITPDFMCVSKGLTAGTMPFAATLTTDRVYDGFRGGPDRTFFYGHSYCANPLGCAAALAVLDAFEEDGILDNVAARGLELDVALADIATLPSVVDVRRTGLVAAIQFGGSQSDYLAQTGWRVFHAALKRGAYLRPLGNVTYLVPALTIASDELAELMRILRESIVAATSEFATE
jgi:adenosylmethionine-8-amino-7-oxononanoate aminotransferase